MPAILIDCFSRNAFLSMFWPGKILLAKLDCNIPCKKTIYKIYIAPYKLKSPIEVTRPTSKVADCSFERKNRPTSNGCDSPLKGRLCLHPRETRSISKVSDYFLERQSTKLEEAAPPVELMVPTGERR